MKRWCLLAAAFLGACSHENEPDFTYTTGEMNEALLGLWQGTAQVDGETVPFSLSLEEATGKAKTETRSRRALPVIGALTSENPAFNGVVDGAFTAFRTLDSVRFELHVDGGVVLYGNVDDQSLNDGHIGGRPADTFSLARP
jgi:hypothetical protein